MVSAPTVCGLCGRMVSAPTVCGLCGRILSAPTVRGGFGRMVSAPTVCGGCGRMVSAPTVRGGFGRMVSAPTVCGLCGRMVSARVTQLQGQSIAHKLIKLAVSVNKPLYAACSYKRVPHYKLFRLIIEAGRNAFASFVYIAPFAAFIHYCCTVL